MTSSSRRHLSYAPDNECIARHLVEDSHSPTCERISHLERRLAELRESSDSMALNLGNAEKALHVLSLENGSQRLRISDDFPRHDDNLHNHIRRGQNGRQDSDRDALRREIASIRSDLRLLSNQSVDYDIDDLDLDLGRHRTYNEARYLNAQNTGYDDILVNDDDLLHSRKAKRIIKGLTGYECRTIAQCPFRDRILAQGRDVPTPRWYSISKDLKYRHNSVDLPFVTSSKECCETGQRSSFSRPFTTQHNRNTVQTTHTDRRSTNVFDTSNKRMFQPYRPNDLSIGDFVKFRRSSGSIFECGRIHYIGHLPGENEVFIGVELETNSGYHDGLHDGFRYFQCKPKRGLFIPFGNIVIAWDWDRKTF